MKTHFLINYKLSEYTKKEMDQFRNKIETKLPAMDRVIGTIIMNKTVSFIIEQVQINLDADEKTIIIRQITSRTILTPFIN